MELTRERLLKVLDYDPTTGIFTWKVRPDRRPWTAKNAGKIAGSPHNGGYIHIAIDRKKYLAHILAWLIVYGQRPARFIDHKNLDKKDNRIDNLRLADFGENSVNASVRSDNTSGFRGVFFEKRRQRWIVYATKNGVRRQFGSFKEKHLAAKTHARVAEQIYGEFCPLYLREGLNG
jgi:hypothetical protein